MKPKINLNEKQQQAVDHIYGPLLVIAGPGTGKTQLLSSRVVNILEQTDTNPENILCLTFTESGATNMRVRLSSIIGRAAAKVHIHTYHAFGRTILDSYQHYSDQPLRLYDRPIDNVTTYQILSTIQSTLPASDILKKAKISDLSATIRELKSARLTPEDIKTIATRNLENSADLNSAISPLLLSLIPRKYEPNIPIYTEILENLTHYTSPDPIVKNIEPEVNFLARSLSETLDDQIYADKPSISPLSKWKDTHFEKDGAGNYRSKNFISNKKLLSLSNIMEQYQTALETEDLFDYADMIEQAITYLSEDSGFRLTQEERYQFILLDEFQDTNPSQFDLVKSLTDYDEPNIMAVGDDDQAIMEFQGAEASNLLDFQNHYSAKIITLTDNYRSTQDILDFSAKISAQISDSFSKAHNIDKRLTSHATKTGTIFRHQFTAAPSEYSWVAEQIAALITQGTSPSDIAILTPKHKYIPTLLPHLSAFDIPVAYEKRENILDDPRIASLLTLAEFIHALATERQSSHLLLPLLTAPHWNIPPLSVITALDNARLERKPALSYLQASPDARLAELATFFANLAARSLDTPLELLLDYMIGSAPLDGFVSPFLDHYTKSELDAFTLYENLSILRETILTHAHKDTLRLSDLVATISAYALASEPITNTSPYQTSEQSVQILSVHKAKGLEFAHVFLVALDDGAWGNAGGNNNTLTLPKNLSFVRHTGITEDERLRVLFVALTRAKTHLYLTSSTEDFSGKSSAPLEYLEEHDGLSPLLPEGSQEILSHTGSTPPLSTLEHHWSTTFHQSIPDLALLLKSRLDTYRLSPTDLTTFIDIVYAGPLTFLTQRLLGAPTPPPDLGVTYGNLIHDTLDFATKNKSTSDTDLLSHYSSLVASADLPEADRSTLAEQGATNLPAILAKLVQVLRAPTSVSEVNFRTENIVLDGIPLTGKIDLLLVDESAKELTVVDYKTSAYDPKKSWTNNPTLFKYRLQLGFYKLLLNNSPKYSRYTVRSASLEHLVPTPHGELISRPYTFPPADELELKSLISSVYRHIMNLDFPETPPDANRTLRDIRTFITALISPED